jgi:hypothetical protein
MFLVRAILGVFFRVWLVVTLMFGHLKYFQEIRPMKTCYLGADVRRSKKHTLWYVTGNISHKFYRRSWSVPIRWTVMTGKIAAQAIPTIQLALLSWVLGIILGVVMGGITANGGCYQVNIS